MTSSSASSSPPSQQRIARLRAIWRDKGVLAAEKEVVQALRTTPKDPNLLHLGAELAEQLGHRTRAISLLRRAVEAYPHFTEAAYNLARLLGREGQDEDAAHVLERAVAVHPKAAMLWQSLVHFRQKAKNIPAALSALETYIDLAPQDIVARGQYYLLCGQICDWRRRPDLGAKGVALPPQAMIVFSDDPAQQLASAESYAAAKFGAIRPLVSTPPPSQDLAVKNRVRVGYLSADFHAHATAYLIAELFELHDKTRFEIFAYSYGIDDGSSVRTRLKNSADHFVILNDLSAAACAEKIQADSIDILIEMKGYTQGSHLDILAYRPAPIQAHWLGFPGTLGASFVDYLFADAETVPPEHEKFFREKIIRLPTTYQINDRRRTIAPAGSRESYGLPPRVFVYASFNQTLKITPEIFEIWMRLLKNTPDSVLWLFESNAFAPAHLREAARAQGVAQDRLIFAKPCPVDEHLARYTHVDLALDTFPYGGHTTTSDALWAGVPVVTLRGKGFPARVAASLLKATGLEDLITTTREDYERCALALAQDQARRTAIKKRLAAQRTELPLFDTPRFVQDWEKALETLVKSRRSGG